MIESDLLQEDNLVEIILKIIADYQPIKTMNILFELGEDDRFKDGITYEEVNEILFQLEKQKRIVREEYDKWKIRTVVAKRPRISQYKKPNINRKALVSLA